MFEGGSVAVTEVCHSNELWYDWSSECSVNRGTIWFTVQITDGTGACQNKGCLLSSYARTENQNGLFHTHKFNPKMLCHCRRLTVGRKEKKKKQKTRLREWQLLTYSGANKNRHYSNWDKKQLSVIARTTWSVMSETTHQNTLTACNTHYKPHYTKPTWLTSVLIL